MVVVVVVVVVVAVVVVVYRLALLRIIVPAARPVHGLLCPQNQ